MSKPKKNVKAAARPASTPKAAGKKRLLPPLKPAQVKVGIFLLLYVFCTFIYGDVFARAEQESFVCADAEAMKFVLDQPFGYLVWLGRYLLLVYKSKWTGGLVLAALLTATACQLDYIFRIPAAWRGVSFLVPFGLLAWFASKGTLLYHMAEPGWVILLPLLVFLCCFAVACCVRLFRKRSSAPLQGSSWKGAAVALIAFCGLTFYASYVQQNAVLTARMQNRLFRQDWEGMVSDGLAARQPSRPVAAYYAVGLLRDGSLLDGLFNIPYNFPRTNLNKNLNRNEEYGVFVTDCDFEAGLVQVAYHDALERTVMHGPALYRYKRMALCAIMMQERELAEKYLRIIECTPFERAFVEKYRPLAQDPTLIDSDEELAAVKQLAPMEDKFEQHYRRPAFLGYNIGLESGSNETLYTSIATCLYSKNLAALLPRLNVLRQRKQSFPEAVQQAIACLAIKRPEVAREFPVSQFMQNTLQSFLIDAKEYGKDKDKRREGLKDRWLGSYIYYYYCENNDSIATGKAQTGSGVN